MKKNAVRRLFTSPVFLGVVILLVVSFGALVGYRLITGKSLGLRSFARDLIYNLQSGAKINAYSEQIRGEEGTFHNIIFLHHSVGNGFINDGHLRKLLKEKGYEMWDQGYREQGLRDPNGRPLGFTYDIPDDNTDPDGLYNIFSQKEYSKPQNALSQLLQHDIIMIKSCYPTSDIRDEARLAQLQQYYLGMRDTFDKNPDKLFIVLTQPPLNPAETEATVAKRARALAEWLKSDEFVGGHPNVAVFDLFDVLAEKDQTKTDANMLREDYRTGEDSHPNANGNVAVAKLLADFVAEKAKAYQDQFLILGE